MNIFSGFMNKILKPLNNFWIRWTLFELDEHFLKLVSIYWILWTFFWVWTNIFWNSRKSWKFYEHFPSFINRILKLMTLFKLINCFWIHEQFFRWMNIFWDSSTLFWIFSWIFFEFGRAFLETHESYLNLMFVFPV